MTDLSFNLLGPLEVSRDGRDLTPSPPKLRRVLATLLLNANLVTSIDQLFDELWEDRSPPSALTTMQTYIYQLRRQLDLVADRMGPPEADRCGPMPTLVTRIGGYELRFADLQVIDVHRFDRLLMKGRAEMDSGNLERAAGTFERALDQWRGPALVDVTTGQRLSVWATQLEERRKGAQERRFSALLELGRHNAIVDEIVAATLDHPTHEGFAVQLMLALHRSGRRPEALNVFRRIRGQMVADLGLEPSAELQRLHQAVLTDDPQLHSSPRRPSTGSLTPNVVPAQLPPGVSDFVAREGELALVERMLDERSGTAGCRVIEVHGPPGIGKTTFAIHAARQVRERFPDGQLFLDVSAVGVGDASLSDLLTTLLCSCGVPRGGLPATVDELSRMFRSWTAERRILIVLDDVRCPEMLRAVLPGGSGCAVISTTPHRSEGFPGAHRVSLPSLTVDESVELFGKIAGLWRVDDEVDSLRELSRWCDLMPWAVRGVAGRLAGRPEWPAVRLLERFRSQRSTLLEFVDSPSGLVGAVAAGFQNIGYAEQYALLVMAEEQKSRHWTAPEVAQLMDGEVPAAEELIDQLVDLHLLEEVATPTPPSEPRPVSEWHCEPQYAMPRLTRQAVQSFAA